jgi:hypothetical protein
MSGSGKRIAGLEGVAGDYSVRDWRKKSKIGCYEIIQNKFKSETVSKFDKVPILFLFYFLEHFLTKACLEV